MAKRLVRLANHLYAFLFGYSWLPCPICREYFGGHEKHGTLMVNLGSGWMTCQRCAAEAQRRNKLLFKSMPAINIYYGD